MVLCVCVFVIWLYFEGVFAFISRVCLRLRLRICFCIEIFQRTVLTVKNKTKQVRKQKKLAYHTFCITFLSFPSCP